LIRPFNINLLSGLVLTIILLGVVSAAAVYVNARTYRDLAFDFQRQYMTRLMAAKTGDMLADEAHQAHHAGLGLQQQDAFRAAYALRDADELAAVLAGFFRQEASSTTALEVTGLYVFGADAGLLAAASRPDFDAGAGTIVCPGLLRLARLQAGEDRSQPLHELCAFNGAPYLATLIAIGEQSAPDYLQVVSDPLPRLIRIGSRLDMPVQVRRMDDSIVYATPGWMADSGSREVLSDFVLSSGGRRVCAVDGQVLGIQAAARPQLPASPVQGPCQQRGYRGRRPQYAGQFSCPRGVVRDAARYGNP
jgi:hypothetical protein